MAKSENKVANTNKGHELEELLRIYFISLGYYTVRGIDVKYKNALVTDIDLWLYNKSSAISRERINVDIKNKKRAQVMERIFWTMGIQKVFGFESCIIASTDNREDVRHFAKLHDIPIMDGDFLQKISKNQTLRDALESKLYEEEFLHLFELDGMGKMIGDWKSKIESAKGRLIEVPSFSLIAEILIDIRFFLDVIFTNAQYRHVAVRGLYFLISSLLIQIDWILKDFVFIEDKERISVLKKGFGFGENGQVLINLLSSLPLEKEFNVSGQSLASWLSKQLDSEENTILIEYFSGTKTIRNLFDMAKFYLAMAYSKTLYTPNDIVAHNLGPLVVLLDYNGVERKKFFENFPETKS